MRNTDVQPQAGRLARPGHPGALPALVLVIVGPILLGALALLGDRLGLPLHGSAFAFLSLLTISSLALAVYRLARLSRSYELRNQQLSKSLQRQALENRTLALLARRTVNAVIITDSEERIRWVNESFTRITGYELSEVVGMRPGDLLQGPETSSATVAMMGEHVRAGRPFQVEVLNYAKGGRRIWLEIEVQPIYEESGDLSGFMAIEQDITERKLMLHRLEGAWHLFQDGPAVVARWELRPPYSLVSISPNVRQFGYTPDDFLSRRICYRDIIHPGDRERVQRELVEFQQARPLPPFLEQSYRIICADGTTREIYDHTVGQVNDQGELLFLDGYLLDITAQRQAEAERQRMIDQMRQVQKMEALGRLAGGIAHDFNNLLTVINGYSDVLLDSMDEENPHRELVAEMAQAGRRASELTGQLLAFSRRQVVVPTTLVLNSVISSMLPMMRRLIGEDLELVVDLALDLWPVQADVGQMQQVVLNLVVNARDAMPGGGRLTISTRNSRLDDMAVVLPSANLRGDYVLLRVSDTGHGMSAETRARIFEPFFTTKEGGRGTGLGLATVFGIVQQSNGVVNVESSPDQGATFTVLLPRAHAVDAAPAAGGVTLPSSGHEVVLLVEDDPVVGRLIEQMLQRQGYTVLATASGHEALKISAAYGGTIHLLITDVVMPQMSGPELAAILRAQRPELRVLLISGYTDDWLEREETRDTWDLFLAKPFSQLSLTSKVREALEMVTHRGGA